MTAFGAYARFYDQLYQDKNYAAEVDYVHSLIQQYAGNATTLLDLGCGTGQHAIRFARQGYAVVGVDRSTEMLDLAAKRCAEDEIDVQGRLEFVSGDIRTVRLEKSFDVTVALFHVMSYQTTNSDLKAAFMTAREHTRPGGIFVFDCWYGPGVLSQPPQVRVKRIQTEDGFDLTRISEPKIEPNSNSVNVEFSLFAVDGAGQCVRVNETHSMRYLFAPEVDLLADAAGFDVLARLKWPQKQNLDATCWNACFVTSNRNVKVLK